MTQHTQETWYAIGAYVETKYANIPLICCCDTESFDSTSSPSVQDYRSEEECRANAQLIAAAPELLAVCLSLQESASYWSDYDVPIGIVDQLNAAILKAQPPLTNPL